MVESLPIPETRQLRVHFAGPSSELTMQYFLSLIQPPISTVRGLDNHEQDAKSRLQLRSQSSTAKAIHLLLSGYTAPQRVEI